MTAETNQTDALILQAGAVPFRRDANGEIEILLVTNSGGDRWIFPKGHIDTGRSSIDQAALEAYEEAGILGMILDPPIGAFRYSKNCRDYEVEVYLMHVREALERWPERCSRRRAWVPFDRAAEVHSRDDAQDIFEVALRHIRSWHALRPHRPSPVHFAP